MGDVAGHAGVVAVHDEPELRLRVERAVGDRGVVVGGLQAHAGIRVAEGNDLAQDYVVAVGTGARVQAVLAARQLQVFQSHTVGVHQLDRVAAGRGVAAVAQGAGRGVSVIVVALDTNARVARTDDQVRGQVVRAVVHTNDIASAQVIGIKDGADG